MHARDLVELAALVAVNGPVLATCADHVSPSLQEEYWAASRCRLDRWTRVLRSLEMSAGELPRPATLAWPRIRPLLEEILAGEMLTRLWTAAAALCDQLCGESDLAPVARNVLAGHLEARRRLLTLLADGRALAHDETLAIDHLRRRIERWTDMLLAHFAGAIDIEEFAHEPARARDFASDRDANDDRAQRRLTSQLVLASIRASVATILSDRSPSADLNRRIAGAILGHFGAGLLDTSVPPQSLWLQRLSLAASEAQGMIDELVAIDRQS
jgi:hypothetical protein